MTCKITDISKNEDLSSRWDCYVRSHPSSNLYHLSGWREVIGRSYGHKCHYLLALDESGSVRGVLPLVHLKSVLFGNALVSIPFFDLGGILADNVHVERELLAAAVNTAESLKAESIELRHLEPLDCLGAAGGTRQVPPVPPLSSTTGMHKVRMVLELPETSDLLMKSFKSKLRSQIRRPMRENLEVRIGGGELVNDFYRIFAENMRDLGSPVHSRKIIGQVFKAYGKDAKAVVIYKEGEPIAGSVMVCYNDTVENPWASALRRHSRLSVNMLLYWTMLEYACDHGFKFFDFGRSTPGEGTYRFKEQWGAFPQPLHWHRISLAGEANGETASEKSRYGRAIGYWQKLPVFVTKIAGPVIRRHISL